MFKEKSNQKQVRNLLAKIEFNQNDNTLILTGDWLWQTIDEEKITKLSKIIGKRVTCINIDGLGISELDTTGAFFISQILGYAKQHQIDIKSFSINERAEEFFARIDKVANDKKPQKISKPLGIFSAFGQSIINFFASILDFTTFFGQFLVHFFNFLYRPLSLSWNDLIKTIYDAGVKGVWVASLLSFLIGVTLTYQMAPQFVTYGANVYVVNFLGIALLKEVSPLLTAVIVAGRTGASIAAEIGTMKVQEEIDAIQTLGISPIKRLVLPKVIGVMIAVPLITSVADMASMLGGAIVANSSLSINYALFIERLYSNVSINNYTVGIYKSIVFALLVSLIGCYCGFRVKGEATSIGEETTRSVVLGIILIVFFDAVFAVICKVLGV